MRQAAKTALLPLAVLGLAGSTFAVEPLFDQSLAVPTFVDEAREALQRVSFARQGSPGQPERLWISIDVADLLRASADDPSLGPPIAVNSREAVFSISAAGVERLAERIHERLRRCGGFFAHATREEALASLESASAAAAAVPTLDQAAVVGPLLPLVSESELRATIEALSAHKDRRYDTADGEAAAGWLQVRWQALAAPLPGSRAELIAHARWQQPSVMLTVPGLERPEEIVVLGGHLDSISWRGASAPGADDNASGIAVLTETIRILSEAGFRPRRTLQFLGYAAEEVGLRGSQEIAKRYAAEGRKVTAVIQFDMTNFNGSGDMLALVDDNVDPGLTAFLGALVDAYVGLPWERTSCGYACSDHASWTRQGFPASAAFEARMEDMNPHIHSPRDTLANCGGTARHSVPFAKLALAFAIEAGKTVAPVVVVRRP